jgi:TM2 domain-containing membrane protein YozV
MGVWKGAGNPPTLEQNIQAGNCPYLPKSILRRQPRALPLDTLPPPLQALMIRCFGEGHRTPERRPRAEEWFQALQDAEAQIVTCRFNGQHSYSKHLALCPWCERIKLGLPDPFPMQAPPPPLPRPTVQLPAYTTTQLAPSTLPLRVYAPQTYPTYPALPVVQPTGATPYIQAPAAGQRQQQMFAPQQMAAPPKARQRSGTIVLIGELLFSIFGIFGIGWCLTGKWGRGVILLLGSFLLYLPIITSMLKDGNVSCVLLLAIGAVVFNIVQLNNEIVNRSKRKNP